MNLTEPTLFGGMRGSLPRFLAAVRLVYCPLPLLMAQERDESGVRSGAYRMVSMLQIHTLHLGEERESRKAAAQCRAKHWTDRSMNGKSLPLADMLGHDRGNTENSRGGMAPLLAQALPQLSSPS